MARRTGHSICPALSRCFSTNPAFASTGTEDVDASALRKGMKRGLIGAVIGTALGSYLYLNQTGPESKVRTYTFADSVCGRHLLLPVPAQYN